MTLYTVSRVDGNQPVIAKAWRAVDDFVLYTHQLKNCFGLLMAPAAARF